METEIHIGGDVFYHMFDESLSDPTIDLMKTYLAVRDYESCKDKKVWSKNEIRWYWQDRTELEFRVAHVDREIFRIYVKAQLYEGESEELETSIEIGRDDFIASMDDFFQQLVNHPAFPLQYPICCDGTDEDKAEIADNLSEKIIDMLPKELQDDEELCYKIDVACTNAIVKIKPDYIDFIKEYKLMLEKHVITKKLGLSGLSS